MNAKKYELKRQIVYFTGKYSIIYNAHQNENFDFLTACHEFKVNCLYNPLM